MTVRVLRSVKLFGLCPANESHQSPAGHLLSWGQGNPQPGYGQRQLVFSARIKATGLTAATDYGGIWLRWLFARLIAMRMKFSQFEDVYLAGLLHDIGIILEDQHLHAAFLEVIGGLQQGKTLSEFETLQFGFDHTTLGGEIAMAWKMPGAIIDAVRYHHGSLLYKGPHMETIRCVEVADYICSLKGIGSVGIHLGISAGLNPRIGPGEDGPCRDC